MAKRDHRKKLVGHLLDPSGAPTIRDVNRTVRCERCGGSLDIRTVPMTGQTVEECRRCGTSQPVRRFLPVGEDSE
jgi:ribosomal protein L37E